MESSVSNHNVLTMNVRTLAVLLTLSGCASVPHAPKVVQVPSNIYVTVPPELDADCAMPALANRTVDGAIDFAIRAKGSLIECSDRMAAIRAIQGSPVK